MHRLAPTVEEVERLQDTISELEEKNSDLESEITKLENKVDVGEAEKYEILKLVKELEDDCDRLTSNLGDVESTIKQLSRYR